MAFLRPELFYMIVLLFIVLHCQFLPDLVGQNQTGNQNRQLQLTSTAVSITSNT